MAILDDILGALQKLPEDHKDLRDSIVSNVKNLNQERGKALSDLNIFKSENETLKGENQNLEKTTMTFKELSEALSKNNMGAKDINHIAEKLQIKKGIEDELSETKRLLDTLSSENKELKKANESRQLQDAIQPKFQQAIKDFKTEDGDPIKLAEDFIPYEELYKPIDLENEALVNDRLKQVLDKALAKQVDFQKRNDMVINGNPVHDTGGGDRHFVKDKGISVEKVLDNMQKEHGSIESAAQVLMAMRESKSE